MQSTSRLYPQTVIFFELDDIFQQYGTPAQRAIFEQAEADEVDGFDNQQRVWLTNWTSYKGQGFVPTIELVNASDYTEIANLQ